MIRISWLRTSPIECTETLIKKIDTNTRENKDGNDVAPRPATMASVEKCCTGTDLSEDGIVSDRLETEVIAGIG